MATATLKRSAREHGHSDNPTGNPARGFLIAILISLCFWGCLAGALYVVL